MFSSGPGFRNTIQRKYRHVKKGILQNSCRGDTNQSSVRIYMVTVAADVKSKEILAIFTKNIKKEKHVCCRTLSFKHSQRLWKTSLSTDSGTWYPSQAVSFLNQNTTYSFPFLAQERKASLRERFNTSRTEQKISTITSLQNKEL